MGPADKDAPVTRSTRRVMQRPRMKPMVDVLAIGAVLVLGVIATLVGIAHERSQASQRDQRTADRAATMVTDRVESTLNTLQGAGSMAVDGEVTGGEFAAYGEQVLRATDLPVLGLAVRVPGDEREGFEEQTGIEVLEQDGDDLVRAGDRAGYLPFVDVVPRSAATEHLLGFDIGSDPARQAAARRATRERRPVLGRRVERGLDGSTGYIVVHSLHTRPDDAPEELVGYVTSVLDVDELVGAVESRLPAGTALALRDRGETVTGDPDRGRSAPVRGFGLGWVVTADNPDGPGIVLPAAIAAATLAVTALQVFSARRDRRYERANDRHTEQLVQDAAHDAVLATVARKLSFAPDSDTAVGIITTDVARVTGADRADVAFLRDRDHLTVPARGDGDGGGPSEGRRAPLDARVPSAEAIRRRAIVVVDDLGADEAAGPSATSEDGVPAGAAAEGTVGAGTVAAAPLFDSAGEPMGVLTFVWARRHHLDEGVLAVIETLARLCGQTLRRTQLADRTAELAMIAAGLAVTSSPADVTARLTESALDSLGAVYLNVRFLDEADEVLRSVSRTGPSDQVPSRDLELPLDSPFPSAVCARTDTPLWVHDRQDWAERFPDSLHIAEALGLHALATLPVHGGRGAPVGVVTFAWASAMRFDPELRSHVTTVTDIAAQTLERARLAAFHQRRAESLARLAQTLATRVTVGGVADAVGTHVPALLAAGRVTVAVVATAGASFDALSVPGRDRDAAVHRDRAVTDTFRSGEPALFPDAGAFRARYPGQAAGDDHRGVEASAFLPLRDAQDRRLGVLAVTWPTPVAFDDELRTLLATLADLLGQTLERAMLHEGEHAVVTTLQKRLLTPAPEVPGLEIATHYEPASRDVGIGGDWYDTIPLDGEGAVVVVGDVTGHGVEAVAAMAQLQQMIAGLVRTGTPLEGIFARANAMVAEDNIYATALLLHLDPGGRRLGHLSAGHPPPLLRRPDGTVTVLSEARQPLIGVPLEPRRLAYVDLPPGSLVLCYTDGLVERRSEPLSAAIGRLADDLAAVADAGGPVPDLLDKLVVSARATGRSGTALDDDVAAVLIRTGA